jgi:hypothetical protein
MKVKVLYSHEVEGTQEFSEPDGWVDSIVGFERHPDFYCLVEFFRSTFTAYGSNGTDNGGRDFLKLIEKNHGPNAKIGIVFKVAPDDVTYRTTYVGEVAVKTFVESVNIDHGLEFGTQQKSTWTDFLSRWSIPVNILSPTDYKGNAVDVITGKDVRLIPQILDEKYHNTQKDGILIGNQIPIYDPVTAPVTNFSDMDDGQITQINLDDVLLNEISTNLNPPLVIYPMGESAKEMFEVEYAGEYDFDFKINLTVFNFQTDMPLSPGNPSAFDQIYFDVGDTAFSAIDIKLFLQINEETPIEFTRTLKENTFLVPTTLSLQTNRWTEFTLATTKSLVVGDSIKIYLLYDHSVGLGYAYDTTDLFIRQLYLLGNVSNDLPMQEIINVEYPGEFLPGATHKVLKDFGTPPGLESYLKITAHTVHPETTAKGFFTHDVMVEAAKRNNIPLYSPYLGNPDTQSRQYESIGCGSNTMLFKGLHVRGYTLAEKPFFISMEQVWRGIDPIECLGLFLDKLNGIDTIKVVQRSELFPDVEPVINLTNVRDIKRKYDEKFFFNQVDIGYGNEGIEDISGIDDPQSMRTLTNILSSIGQKIEIISEFIAGSYFFEWLRRDTLKTKDNKFDNDTLILAVVKDGDDFIPETNENFTSVSNLANESTRYNKRLTPYRNFIKFLNFISVGLYAYLDSTWKFSEGTLNYDMVSTMTGDCLNSWSGPLSEKQDIPVTEGYFIPMPYTINHYLTQAQWLIWKKLENLHKPIGASQTETINSRFHVFDMQYNQFTGMLQVIACPKEIMDLEFIEGEPLSQYIFDESFEHPIFE